MTARIRKPAGPVAAPSFAAPADTRAPSLREVLQLEIRRSAVADRLELRRIVVQHRERIVGEGVFDGSPCFVKLFISDNPGRTARLAEAAVAAARRHMAQGRFQVAPVLFTARRRGFVVLEAAPGVSLEAAIAASDGAGRAQLIRLAGSWLAAYCAPRREARRFSAARFGQFHLPRMATPGWNGERRDSPLIRALAERLAMLAPSAEGAPLSIAITHGDFVARNFHHDAGAIHGFDIESRRALPIAWDLALFLVEMTGREGAGGRATRRGMPAADAEALVASGVVDEEEATTVLPLYIGHHLLRRCIRMGPAPPFFDNITEAAGRFLAETGG